MKILIINPDQEYAEAVAKALIKNKHDVFVTTDLDKINAAIRSGTDAVLLAYDLRSAITGVHILELYSLRFPKTKFYANCIRPEDNELLIQEGADKMFARDPGNIAGFFK